MGFGKNFTKNAGGLGPLGGLSLIPRVDLAGAKMGRGMGAKPPNPLNPPYPLRSALARIPNKLAANHKT
jgi:hypothetical protein